MPGDIDRWLTTLEDRHDGKLKVDDDFWSAKVFAKTDLDPNDISK